jgi:hypothetical protein
MFQQNTPFSLSFFHFTINLCLNKNKSVFDERIFERILKVASFTLKAMKEQTFKILSRLY